ncbi:hypothetical protein MRX96_058591 [Rhipicephalus microplus]
MAAFVAKQMMGSKLNAVKELRLMTSFQNFQHHDDVTISVISDLIVRRLFSASPVSDAGQISHLMKKWGLAPEKEREREEADIDER